MPLRSVLRAPRGLVLLIALVTVLPLAILLWVGWRLLAQDRALEQQQIAQRLERGADLAVGALQQALAQSRHAWLDATQRPPEGAVLVRGGDGQMQVEPAQRVAHLPFVPPLPEAPPAVFARGDDLDLRQHARDAAAEEFRHLSSSSDERTQAGALVRLGAVLYAQGHADEALDAYARLIPLDDVGVADVPAGLIARYARCRILAAEHRDQLLHQEASELASALTGGRWLVTAPTYALYAEDARHWAGQSSIASSSAELLADSIAVFWERWKGKSATAPASGVDVVEASGQPITVLWETSDDGWRWLVANPAVIDAEWFSTLANIERAYQLAIDIRTPDGRVVRGAGAQTAPHALRAATATLLPWTLTVTSVDPPPERQAFIARRRWLTSGFLVLALMAVTAGVVIVRSVSQRLAVAQQQSDFVAAVSHEFRTPLTSLRQFTEMLRDRPLDDNRRQMAYDAQARATDRLSQLVESLLDFGRMEAGARRYQFEAHDGADLVRQVVDDYRAQTSAMTARPITVQSAETARLAIDADAMSLAVRNLIENAVKYSPAGSPVEVRTARHGQQFTISVSDHGLGIPVHERAKIFTRFHRGEDARRLGINGTGIGLAMVREIIQAHRGSIEVDSAPGVGSTFTIRLPLDAALSQ